MNDAILTELQAMHGTLRRIAEALEGKPASQTPGTPSQTRPATLDATRTPNSGSKPQLKIGGGLKPRLGTHMSPMPTAAPKAAPKPSVGIGGVSSVQTQQRTASPPPPPPRPAPSLDVPRPVARDALRLDIDDDIPF